MFLEFNMCLCAIPSEFACLLIGLGEKASPQLYEEASLLPYQNLLSLIWAFRVVNDQLEGARVYA